MSGSQLNERLGRHVIVVRMAAATAASLWISAAASAQCPSDWLPGEGAPGVVGDATVFASTTWDPDGGGPEAPLAIFGGTLLAAGDLPVRSIAAWDGAAWHALGDGLPAQVRALTVYNGDLVAAAGHSGIGGVVNGVARWDGTSWHAIGSGFQNVVWTLAVYNGDLIAGGLFNSAGGTPVNNIARWNGLSWQPLGAGIAGGCRTLTVFEGDLLAASGNAVLRWNGTSWETFGSYLAGAVNVFASYNGELVIGGWFRTAPGGPALQVARWDGGAWQPIGGGMSDHVHTLTEFNGELIAGGIFTNVEGRFAYRMARWNGSSWLPIFPGPGMPVRRCDSLVVYNGELYAGGAGTRPSGLQAEQVGRWNGQDWNYLGGGIDQIVYDFETYHGDLIAGGWFYTAGDIVANGIARRDSAGVWHPMGGVSGGDGYVFDLVVYNDVLIASGSFAFIDGVPVSSVAQWDGQSWQPFGDTPVGKKLVHEGDLYAPGDFGVNQRVARWDPEIDDWQPLGTFPSNSGITCLTTFNGDLIAGGTGATASVWRWDFDAPGTWHAVGQQTGFLQTLSVYNGELLAGGYINGGLLRLDGSSWVTLGGGLFLSNDLVADVLAVFDLRVYNGELVVAGSFGHAGEQQYSPGSVTAYHIVRWNGTSWFGFDGLQNGCNDASVTLHEHNGELIIGGWFDRAGGRPNGHWARWGPAVGDLDGSGATDLDDAGAFVDCLDGPNAGLEPGCDCADADVDGDVDLADTAQFQNRFSGP